METRIQNVDVHYVNIELALRRGGEEGQDSKLLDVRWTVQAETSCLLI